MHHNPSQSQAQPPSGQTPPGQAPPAQADPAEDAPGPNYLIHESEFPLYALGFSNQGGNNFNIAVGSFLASDQNMISLLEVPPGHNQILCRRLIPQPYPCTMIRFHPNPAVS